jgi:pimeloyl-ACP methyl ester carboxylesterase
MQHRYATVNGIQLHYAQAGQGKLILFLHGFPEFWYAWKDQLAEFGKDHLAVAPDQRGYNLSDKPSEVTDYAATNLVADIQALAAHLNGGKPFILVGHDWGGAIAWTFAIRHPELVEKLVIINAPHPGVFDRELAQNAAQQQASQYMLLFRSPTAEQTLSANNYAPLVNGIFGELKQSGKITDADIKMYLDAWSQPGALTGGLNWYRAARVGPPVEGKRESLTTAVGADALSVKVPTLVIWGEKDTALLTGNLVGLDEYVPHLTIKRIPEGSHWVIHEQPERINRLIREFLATQ